MLPRFPRFRRYWKALCVAARCVEAIFGVLGGTLAHFWLIWRSLLGSWGAFGLILGVQNAQKLGQEAIPQQVDAQSSQKLAIQDFLGGFWPPFGPHFGDFFGKKSMQKSTSRLDVQEVAVGIEKVNIWSRLES